MFTVAGEAGAVKENDVVYYYFQGSGDAFMPPRRGFLKSRLFRCLD